MGQPEATKIESCSDGPGVSRCTFQAVGTEVSPPGSSTTTGNSTCGAQNEEANIPANSQQARFTINISVLNRCEISIPHQRRHAGEHSQLVSLALRLVLAQKNCRIPTLDVVRSTDPT